MELWFPGAKRTLTFTGSGPHVFGPYRGVLHTTEGDSIAGALATYKKTRSYPHFTLDEDTIEQHCPINVGATALAHPARTVETNRASAIQIEIVGHAAEAYHFPPPLLVRIAELMRWVEAQTGIDFYSHPPFAGSSSTRFTETEWRRFGGWCGHQHVPHNDHWDPGALPIDKLAPLGFPKAIPKAEFGPVQQYGDTMQRQEMTTLPLDDNGNGFHDTHIPFDKFVTLIANGPSPDRDGGYNNPKWPDWRWTYNNTDGQARIAIEGGKAGQPVSFVTWRVD